MGFSEWDTSTKPMARRAGFPLIDQLFATLMRLRLGLLLLDLADRFHVSSRKMDTAVTMWMLLLEKELRALTPCPPQETVLKDPPPLHMPGLRFLLECYELNVESPSRVHMSAERMHHYRHHTAVQFMVAFSPQGLICYVSNGVFGKASGEDILQRSDFLDLV